MAELSDIQNQTLVDEIEEYLERPEEIERFIELFSAAKPMLQDIAAAIIEGDDDGVDELTTKALESGIEAIEIMDDGDPALTLGDNCNHITTPSCRLASFEHISHCCTTIVPRTALKRQFSCNIRLNRSNSCGDHLKNHGSK